MILYDLNHMSKTSAINYNRISTSLIPGKIMSHNNCRRKSYCFKSAYKNIVNEKQTCIFKCYLCSRRNSISCRNKNHFFLVGVSTFVRLIQAYLKQKNCDAKDTGNQTRIQ